MEYLISKKNLIIWDKDTKVIQSFRSDISFPEGSNSIHASFRDDLYDHYQADTLDEIKSKVTELSLVTDNAEWKRALGMV